MDERERELQIMAAAYDVVVAAHLIHGVYIVPENVMNVLGGLMLGAEADSEDPLGEGEEYLDAPQSLRPLTKNDFVDSLGEPVELDDEDFDIDELARSMPLASVKEIRILTPQEFIRGGKAVFTLTDLNTGKHFTYRINKWQKDKRFPAKWFVNLGTGYNDSVKFCELQGMAELNANRTHVNGLLNTTGWVVGAEAPSRKLFERFIHTLNTGVDLESHDIKFQHAGRCCMCSRELTAPESIEMGIGPECLGNAGFE